MYTVCTMCIRLGASSYAVVCYAAVQFMLGSASFFAAHPIAESDLYFVQVHMQHMHVHVMHMCMCMCMHMSCTCARVHAVGLLRE